MEMTARRRTSTVRNGMRNVRPTRGSAWLLVASLVIASVFVLLLAGRSRELLLPVLFMVVVAAIFAATLFNRDGQLPVFEPASFAVAATLLYGAFPLVNFVAGGLAWSPHSDNRLIQLADDPADVAQFGWRYALYLATFVIVYLLFRGKRGVRSTSIERPSRPTVVAIATTAFAAWALLRAIALVYGISYSPSYAELTAGSVRTIASLPLFVAQVAQNVASMQLLLWQLIVALLILNWRHLLARFVLVAFLAAVAIDVMVVGGSRSQLVLLMMAAALLYHRLVRPLKLTVAVALGGAIVIGFILIGINRDISSSDDLTVLTAGNEFQAILGTPFDLRDRLRAGEIVEVPWQVYWADLLALVPSQLLPFEKVDPSLWYLKVASIDSGGYVFGLMAQVIIGGDWLELLLRGVALALVLAILQRWYVRNSESFWMTMLIMYLSVWMYYTVRQSTFSFAYVLVYRFAPVFVIVQVVRYLLTSASRIRRRIAPSVRTYPSGPGSE